MTLLASRARLHPPLCLLPLGEACICLILVTVCLHCGLVCLHCDPWGALLLQLLHVDSFLCSTSRRRDSTHHHPCSQMHGACCSRTSQGVPRHARPAPQRRFCWVATTSIIPGTDSWSTSSHGLASLFPGKCARAIPADGFGSRPGRSHAAREA